jgi:hypothetical protein
VPNESSKIVDEQGNYKFRFQTFRPRRVEVEIEDKLYFLEEMTEGKAREFRKLATRIGRTVEDARAKGADMPDDGLRFNVILLSMCMYEVTGHNGDGLPTYKLVGSDFLDALPASVIEALDREARSLNGMDDRAQAREEAKNS